MDRMYQALWALALLAVVSGGAIVPHADNSHQQDAKQTQNQPTNGNKPPVYSASQDGRPSGVQYYYPTYPDYSSNGYSVQHGYEGYIVPVPPSQPKRTTWSSNAVTTLLPILGSLLTLGAHAGTYVLYLAISLILGVAVTTGVCTYTPLCSISFLGQGLIKSQVKEQVAELARTYITPENLNSATMLVTRAMDKYAALQQEVQGKAKQTVEAASEDEKDAQDV